MEDEDEAAAKEKKKKKKKPKKKKKKPTAEEAAAVAAETPNIEQLSLNAQTSAIPATPASPAPPATRTVNGTPATPTSPAKSKKPAAKPAPIKQPALNTSTTTLPGMSPSSISLGRTETAQSAHKYLKEEGLLSGKEKVKSRADYGNLSSVPEKKGYWSRFSRRDKPEEEPEDGKKGNKFSFFSKLSKKTSTYMHQLLKTSEDEKKGLAPMKWGHFLKVCSTWTQADEILSGATGHARDGLHV